MRPLCLQITGLNSFREKVSIDFDRLLLGGLFGIFGPTGSGKSTILDAMTLALYGKVRRAPGGTQGIVNVREPHCSVSLTFEVGEDGTRRRYTIDRMLRRNTSGGVETRRMRLLRYQNGVPVPIAEKRQELKARIDDIIGITADDFQRAVVLPQGAFAEFLGLEARERGAALQRLFGLYDLGDRLNRLLKERAAALVAARAEVEGRMRELRAYNDEALAAAREAAVRADERQREIRTRLQELEKSHQEAAILYGQIEEYRMLMDAADARREQERMVREGRERLERAGRSRIVASAVEVYRDAARRFSETEARYRDAVSSRDQVQHLLDAARNRFERAASAFPSRYDILAAELDMLGRVKEGEQALRERQARLDALNTEFSAISERCEMADSERAQVAERIRGYEQDAGRLESELRPLVITNDQRRRIEALRQGLRDLSVLARECNCKDSEIESLVVNIGEQETEVRSVRQREAAVRSELEQFVDEREQLKRQSVQVSDHLGRLSARRADLQRVLAETEEKEWYLRKQRSELEKHRASFTAAAHSLQELELHLKEAITLETIAVRERDAIQSLRGDLLQRNVLASLLPTLHDGEPCLLCGSPYHPDPCRAELAGSGELAELEGKLAQFGQKVQGVGESVRDLERSVAGTRATMEAAELRIEDLGLQIRAQEETIRLILGELDPDDKVDSKEALHTLIERVTDGEVAGKRNLEEIGRNLAQVEGRIGDWQTAALDVAQQRAGLEAALDARQRRLMELQGVRNELHEQIQALTSSINDRSGGRALEELRIEVQAQYDREEKAETIREQCESIRIKLGHERESLALREKELREIEQMRDRFDGERRSLASDIGELRADLARKFISVVPEAQRRADVDVLIESRQRERDLIQREFDDARRLYDEKAGQEMVAREKVDNYWNELCREELVRDEADRRCRKLIQEQGFTSLDEMEAAFLSEEEFRSLQNRTEETASAIMNAAKRLSELRKEIGGREITAEALSELEMHVKDVCLHYEEAMQAFGGVQERLREHQEKNAEWKRVCREDVSSAENAATVEQLTRYLRGNAFVDFLANERLTGICRNASIQLGMLTSGRLEIRSRPKDGFYICDNGNGGAERLPSSLSGGETFLVSLSLALALSEAIQLGRAPLEFFFLDEGFGTLDADLLDTVMNSLERIRSEHRAIGVISHVAQLRERIPRRLIVAPATERSGSTVRYEMA